MRYTDPDQSASHAEISPAEEKLRKENLELRRRLEELNGGKDHQPAKVWRPSSLTIFAILLTIVVLLAGAFAAGFIPRQKRMSELTAEAKEQTEALPRVEVIQVGRSGAKGGLQIAGNLQAVTEAPILARADGYLAKRFVDIGDRVKAGQALAEVDAPELDAQVRQAKATVEQAQAGLEQAQANLDQSKSDLELARVTAERWETLGKQGVVSRQANDQYRLEYQSKVASTQALEKAVNVHRSAIIAAQATVNRLERMQGYRTVKAPFDGVITLRNVDPGALVSTGSTLLFRVAQTSTLRAYVSVPQTHASSIRPGQTAILTVANLPGRLFNCAVARTANALDPASRTLLVELNVPNADGALLPGMYAQVELNRAQRTSPIFIPSDALIIRADGAQVAVVLPDHRVHLQKINVARDYGDRLEISGGLEEGQTIIANPGDVAREGMKVEPVTRKQASE